MNDNGENKQDEKYVQSFSYIVRNVNDSNL